MKSIRTLRERGLKYIFLAGIDKSHCEISILPFYRPFAKRYYQSKARDVDRYDVPLNPFTKRFVNPKKIVYTSEFPEHTYPPNRCMRQFGRVAGEEWDQGTYQFSQKSIYKTLRQRFKQDVDWKETPYIKKSIRKVQNGERTWHGCSSIRDIEHRCKYLEELYEQISQHGFRSQKDIRSKISYPREFVDEIRIDIGRDGTPLYIDGKHRLSIAKILEIESVPVTVMVRHRAWVEHLEKKYYENDIPDHFDVMHL